MSPLIDLAKFVSLTFIVIVAVVMVIPLLIIEVLADIGNKDED